MCVTKDNFNRSRVFVFLSEIKRKFLTAHGSPTASPYVIKPVFYRILFIEMKSCNECPEYDSIVKVNEQFHKIQGIKLKNEENVENLVEKSESLNNRVSFPASQYHK